MEYTETGDFPRSIRGLHSNSTFQQLPIIFNPYPEQHDGKEEGSQTYEIHNFASADSKPKEESQQLPLLPKSRSKTQKQSRKPRQQLKQSKRQRMRHLQLRRLRH
jgi:hypothetical protein